MVQSPTLGGQCTSTPEQQHYTAWGCFFTCPFSHPFLGQRVGARLCFTLLTKPSMVGWKKEWKIKTHSSPHAINHTPPPGLVHIGKRSLAFCRRLKVTGNGTSNWAITRRGRIPLGPHTPGRCSYRKSNVLKCPGISTLGQQMQFIFRKLVIWGGWYFPPD